MSTAPLLAVLRAHPAGLSQHEVALATGLEMEAVYQGLGVLLKRGAIWERRGDRKMGSVYVVKGSS
jgi:DNA-binding IclR family transcriptional regulator